MTITTTALPIISLLTTSSINTVGKNLTPREHKIFCQTMQVTPTQKIIRKWKKDIVIKIKGTYNYSDRKEIKKIIKDINSLIKKSNIKMRLAKKAEPANTTLTFTSSSNFPKRFKNEPSVTYLWWGPRKTNVAPLKKARIFISTSKNNKKQRLSSIRQTLMQTIGFLFLKNTTSDNNNLLTNKQRNLTQFSQLDKKLISFLYNNSLDNYFVDHPRTSQSYSPYTITINNRTFSHELQKKAAKYFFKVAFGADYGDKTNRIRKWTDDIKIGIRGTLTDKDRTALNNTIFEIKSLISESNINIKIVTKEPNLLINYTAHNNFKRDPDLPDIHKHHAYAITSQNRTTGEIYFAKIYISTDKSQQFRDEAITEELIQSLGLMRDTNNKESIFYNAAIDNKKLHDIDRLLVKYLYSKDIKPGMTPSEVKNVFRRKGLLE